MEIRSFLKKFGYLISGVLGISILLMVKSEGNFLEPLWQRISFNWVDKSVDLVSTESNWSGSRLPWQKNSFYAQGRYWVFYGNYSNMRIYYKTSTDGNNWGSEKRVADFPLYDADWTIYFDGTYVHYTRNLAMKPTSHSGLAYRRGEPQLDGTISWSSEEQIIFDTTHEYGDMSLIVDSNGYPWISYGYKNMIPQVIKSSKNDGTWVMADGFPHNFPQFDSIATLVILAPLADGEVYALFYPWTTIAKFRGQYWNGSVWLDEGEITMSNPADIYVSPVDIIGYKGEINIVFMSSDLKIKYRKRDSGGHWETEITLDESHCASGETGGTSPVITVDDSNGNLYVLWQNYSTGDIWIKRYIDGTWDSASRKVLHDSFENTTAHLMSYEKVGNNRVGITYLTSDFQVRHKILYTSPKFSLPLFLRQARWYILGTN